MDSLQSTLVSLTGLRNISLLVVPALWVNSIAAHFYAVSLTRGRFTNSSPRDYLSSIQKKEKKTSTDLKFIRAEAAQQNGFENLPFAAAAFVAGIVAKLPVAELNSWALLYLISRVVYNLLYINTTSESLSNARSVVFVGGIGILFKIFISSAIALNKLA
ncbi:hypothetical protein BDZ90DRAFT_244315 [Jaminaea rosea]|uniref:Membrane-associated proteins in eicosanoid and glutathione metabolism n=1 Tax=Jaminaea rosea TaxID=1569628 RepID=A0A316UNS4_9BASI|nr:hypothetical protein BDZ90DRAFT_244315 [Jaminaea rosea]PWN24815.1 hypothetical protein BDZ90DRAFT_244315 [Jaminaea rosea]